MSGLPSPITDGLNKDQLNAVTADVGNQLVLAGAGSGKTRVLVHRMAYLIEHYGCRPNEVMAVTFTNKAAREMSERISALSGLDTSRQWIGTFHALCARLLRINAAAADLTPQFQIIDTSAQEQVLRRIINEMGSEETGKTDIGAIANWISKQKDGGFRAFDVIIGNTPQERKNAQLYELYERYCQRMGLVDFGEMILRTYELLHENENLLRKYRAQFKEILVDEFQDTNAIQYAWIKLLAGKSGHVMAVGDDDQSIYGWRGARVENIRNFQLDFSQVSVVRLEQNYRSTANILSAANHLIDKNSDRLGKKLWTEASKGLPVQLFQAHTGSEEAVYVVDALESWVHGESDRNYSDIAVLYRSHYQSQVFEHQLSSKGIPYVIRGGLRFYDRAEVRDALAYMQLMVNPNADLSFLRVLRAMPRGIGARSQEKITQLANQLNCSLWTAAEHCLKKSLFPNRLSNALSRFLIDLSDLKRMCEGKTLRDIASICAFDSGLAKHYEESESSPAIAEARVENLGELVRACGAFEGQISNVPQSQPGETTLQRFLDKASLDAGDEDEDIEFKVNLMTLHASKGLEFKLVLLVGWEENIFPAPRSVNNDSALSEERRLAYVGITRAMEALHLTYATSRSRFGSSHEKTTRSRFLEELPQESIQIVRHVNSEMPPVRPRVERTRTDSWRTRAEEVPAAVGSRQKYRVGDLIEHDAFGSGRVVEVMGFAKSERVNIVFDDGRRRMILGRVRMMRKRT